MILSFRELPLRLFAFALGLLTLLGVVATRAEAGGPPVQALLTASPLEVGKAGALTVELRVPAGVVVYSAETYLTPLSKGALTLRPVEYPPGEMKPDPVTGELIEVWSSDVALRVPVEAPKAVGRHDLALELRVVGCKGNICFLPHTETLRATVEVKPKAVGWLDTLLPSAYAGKLNDENPVSVSVKVKGEGLAVSFAQAPGWHLTQSFTFIELAEGQDVTLGKVGWPKAHQRPDPAIPGATRGEYDGDFTVNAALKAAPGSRVVKGTVGYQACKAELCLMPQYLDFSETVTFAAPVKATPTAPGAEPVVAAPVEPVVEPVEAAVEPVVEAPAVEEPPVVEAPPVAAPPTALADNSGAEAFDAGLPVDGFAAAREKGLIWLIAFVFGAGFLVSLTPCVLPMVPITVGLIGARSTGSRLQAFSLALAYVAGLATVYTLLGVGAAMTGSIFGAWMQSPWVVGAVAAFFFAMGASMFGAFEVAVPGAIAERLNNVGGAGYTGAFLIGAVGAIVAGPCSGPVIASLMVVIGQQGELALGAGLMLAFSLGMGMIFLVAGTFSNQVLRPGAWMETVKHSFGVLMWLGAVYFVAPHLSDAVTALLTAFVLLSTAVFAWPQNDDDGPAIARAHRLYAVVGGLVGAYLLMGTLVTQGFILPPLQLSAAGAATPSQSSIPWVKDDEAAALSRASAEGKPLIIDFTAEWCAACKELEHFTYTDAEVIAASAAFVPLMIDATSDKDPKVQALLKKYDVKGLPTVLFLKPDGEVISKLTLTGFEPAEKFLPRMKAAQRMAK